MSVVKIPVGIPDGVEAELKMSVVKGLWTEMLVGMCG